MDVAQRMTAYIAPRAPCTDAERAAFDSACAMQAEFEASPVAGQLAQLPDGVSSFTVNGFSASFNGRGRGASLFPGGLCPDARAVLFNAGLLYRGAGLC